MQWWWIASLWRPSILTQRNQGDNRTEFIIIQATDVTKTGRQLMLRSKLPHSWKETHSAMQTATSDLSGQSYQRLTSFNSSLTVLFPIYRALAIRGRIKFRLLLWQDDVWVDKSVSRYSCLATCHRPHNSSITYRCPVSNTLTLGGWPDSFRSRQMSSFIFLVQQHELGLNSLLVHC